MDNPYQPINTKIIEIIDESPAIKTFVLRPERKVGFSTGQFVELYVQGEGEAPFTPSSSPNDTEKLDITIMKVGKVTSLLHSSRVNDSVGIRGPYGNGYPLEEFKKKEVLIVGGGVGLAPLRSLIFALLDEAGAYRKILIRYGSRTPQDIIYKGLVREWGLNKKLDLAITVDRGDDTWKGRVGLVTTLLDDVKVNLKNSIAVVCGPPIMMKFTTYKLLDIGYRPEDLYLSLEKNMSCGIGKCGHCRVGQFYICKDGPVFRYDKVKDLPELWD